MKCVKCKAELDDGVKTCSACGASQEAAQQPASDIPLPGAAADLLKQKSGKSFAILSLVSVAIACLLLIITFVFMRFGGPCPGIVFRILWFLRLILSLVGIITGVVALIKKECLGIAGIVLAVLGWFLLPHLLAAIFF